LFLLFYINTAATRPEFIVYGFATEFQPNSKLAQPSLVKEIALQKGKNVNILGDPPKPQWNRAGSTRSGFEIRPGFPETPLSTH
jgi:hypothetical protein